MNSLFTKRLLEGQAELKLCNAEVVFIQNLTFHQRHGGEKYPRPSVGLIAERMGMTERGVQKIINVLDEVYLSKVVLWPTEVPPRKIPPYVKAKLALGRDPVLRRIERKGRPNAYNLSLLYEKLGYDLAELYEYLGVSTSEQKDAPTSEQKDGGAPEQSCPKPPNNGSPEVEPRVFEVEKANSTTTTPLPEDDAVESEYVPVDPSIKAVVVLLESKGLTPKTAEQLARIHSRARIEEVLREAVDKSDNNPAGFIVTALARKFEFPPRRAPKCPKCGNQAFGTNFRNYPMDNPTVPIRWRGGKIMECPNVQCNYREQVENEAPSRRPEADGKAKRAAIVDASRRERAEPLNRTPNS